MKRAKTHFKVYVTEKTEISVSVHYFKHLRKYGKKSFLDFRKCLKSLNKLDRKNRAILREGEGYPPPKGGRPLTPRRTKAWPREGKNKNLKFKTKKVKLKL